MCIYVYMYLCPYKYLVCSFKYAILKYMCSKSMIYYVKKAHYRLLLWSQLYLSIYNVQEK